MQREIWKIIHYYEKLFWQITAIPPAIIIARETYTQNNILYFMIESKYRKQ